MAEPPKNFFALFGPRVWSSFSSLLYVVHSPSLYSMHCVDRSPMTDRDSVKLAHHLCQYFSATFRRGQEMPSMRTHAMAHGSRNGQTRSPIFHMPTCTYNMYVICRHCDCMWGSTRCLYLKLFWFADLHFFFKSYLFWTENFIWKKLFCSCLIYVCVFFFNFSFFLRFFAFFFFIYFSLFFFVFFYSS